MKFCYVAFAWVILQTACYAPAQVNDSEIQVHRTAAADALKANDLVRAESEYRAIIALNPKNVEAYAALGVALYASGNFRKAFVALHSALELDPTQPRVELFLGLTQSELGQCDDAVPILKRQLSEQPDRKLRRLAGLSALECEVSGNHLDSALEIGQQLKADYPDDADVLYKLAGLYTSLWDQAAGDLMQKHPESYRVHQLAGEVYEAQGKGDQAIREYSLALKENDRIAGLHARMGQILLQQGSPDSETRALAEFQRELGVNPKSAIAEYAIGEIYRRRQDYAQANLHLQRAVALDVNLAEAHIAMAQIFMVQHDAAKSRQEAEIAVHLQPENATAHYTLMVAYRSEGKMEDANREMALFQRLQQAHQANFNNKMTTLLSGKAGMGPATD